MAKKKKLKKSKTDKIIFGIIGGMAEYFQMDSTLLRIVFLVIASLSGFVPGMVAYFLSFFIVPNK